VKGMHGLVRAFIIDILQNNSIFFKSFLKKPIIYDKIIMLVIL